MSPEARVEPPAPPPAPLRSPQPAAELGRLLPGQAGRKGAVGGVEQVVALVEHDPLQPHGLYVGLQPRAARAPSKAAWVITSAWLAITTSARFEARTARSMKQAL
jgi:hypothetical protein